MTDVPSNRAKEAQALLVRLRSDVVDLLSVLCLDSLGGQPHAISKAHHDCDDLMERGLSDDTWMDEGT